MLAANLGHPQCSREHLLLNTCLVTCHKLPREAAHGLLIQRQHSVPLLASITCDELRNLKEKHRWAINQVGASHSSGGESCNRLMSER